MFAWLAMAAIVVGCTGNGEKSDAYGNFEATEIIVSAESAGKIMAFNAEEGTLMPEHAFVGYIDTVQLALKRDQLSATKLVIHSRSGNILSQIEVIDEQKKVALVEKERVEKLIKQDAATQKQLDDITGQISVLEKQKVSIETQNASVFAELKSVESQIKQISDQINKSVIVNPIAGTILTKYVEPFEVVAYGKALYKIADMRSVYLRIFVSGDQLPQVKLGQKVQVLIDETKKTNSSLEGEVSWISSKAEFTPKIIQTKEERVNMVYAVKVKVQNDGRLKIGMPGEVNLKLPKDNQ